MFTVTVNLPANTRVEYKYIRKNNGVVTWESDPNRVLVSRLPSVIPHLRLTDVFGFPSRLLLPAGPSPRTTHGDRCRRGKKPKEEGYSDIDPVAFRSSNSCTSSLYFLPFIISRACIKSICSISNHRPSSISLHFPSLMTTGHRVAR